MGQRRIGQLRHRVAIQAKTVEQGDYGEPIETWATSFTDWGSINDLSAGEGIQGRAELQEVSTVIVMRNRETVTPEMRAVWDSHTYEIKGVVRQDRRVRMELYCTESV